LIRDGDEKNRITARIRAFFLSVGHNMNSKAQYFDHGATSPLRKSAYKAMKPFLKHKFGNAASAYSIGREAKHAVDAARDLIAGLLSVESSEIIFTSGGSESIALSLIGAYTGNRHRGRHILMSPIEHAATIGVLDFLKDEMGADIQIVSVDSDGIIKLDDFESKIRDDTVLVSIMRVNNETGTIQPVEIIVEMCKGKNIIVQSDCVQSFGKTPTDLRALGIDLAMASAHKFGGPKGVGFMYVRQGTYLKSLIPTSHEFGFRAGTVNVAGVVGMAAALEEASEELPELMERMKGFRERLFDCIKNVAPDAEINGSLEHCIPATLNVLLPGCEGEMLVYALDMAGIEASTGSACASGATEPSHVLIAMGRNKVEALNTLRLSMGYSTTRKEIDKFIREFPGVYERIKSKSVV
jgi:cysteine desulfurase